MNIHEYQAKAILREFGVPVVARRRGDRCCRSRQSGRRELPGPVYRREGANPCGRARQRQVQGSRGRSAAAFASRARAEEVESLCAPDARPHARHGADRACRQAGQPALYRRRLGDREGILSRPARRPRRRAGSLSSPRPKAAWRSRRSRKRRRKRSSASPSIRRPGSCRITAARSPRRLGSPAISPNRPRNSRRGSTRPLSPRTWRCLRSIR